MNINLKRWALCAFLLLICYLVIRVLDGQKILEAYGGGHGGGGRGGGHGGGGRGGGGRYGGHRGGHGGFGYGRGWGYGGGALAVNPVYIYDDYEPYWYRYIPFYNYYY